MIKIEFAGKTYVWKCLHHNVELEGGGHSRGMGVECWEGMMFDYTTSTWSADSSELFCPSLGDDYTDEQFEECQESWELVEVSV